MACEDRVGAGSYIQQLDGPFPLDPENVSVTPPTPHNVIRKDLGAERDRESDNMSPEVSPKGRAGPQ